MKKRIICLLLVALTLLAVCSCACVRGDKKYDYDDMSEYITLPNYLSHTFSCEEDSIKQAIGTYLMQYSSEYTIKRGDRVNVDLKFFNRIDPETSLKGDEIKELYKDDFWLEHVATPDSDGNYQISYQVENGIIGSKLKATITKEYTLAEDFYVEEYRGKTVFVDITVNNTVLEMGDVLIASYTGYYVDENGKIIQENGKDKTFDSSEKSSFYIGSHLAIEDFEQGLIGMTVGVEKDIYATFPEDYKPAANMAGKKVMFRVKVTSLFTPPTYNDAFVQNYFTTFKTVAEFEEALRNEYLLSLVYEYITQNAVVIEYPKAEYKAAEKQLLSIEGSFAQQMNTTLDAYLKSEYGMTRDAYIKSNMKTEMIFYSLRTSIGASVEPTEEEMDAEKDALVAYYKSTYMKESGYTETQALAAAKEFVDNLGDSYIYEQVLYTKIDKYIPAHVKTTSVPSAHESYVFDAQEK